MRVLIVDDEPPARQVLREELESLPFVTGVEEAEDGVAALEKIRAAAPDVVLLDIQMPGLSGFEVIRSIESGPMPVVIVVTAFDEHAIRAFEEGAVDYLLKPVRGERLAMALERASRVAGRPREAAEQMAALQSAAAIGGGGKNSGAPRKIVGRIGEEYFLLSPDEVLAFQAEGDVVWIITPKRKFLASATLRVLQQKLQGLPFQRIHRNALVNVTRVRKMAALSSQRWLLTLDNNQEFIVSKRQARSVREILSW